MPSTQPTLISELRTEQGAGHKTNEDTILADTTRGLYIVCDGVSNPPGGKASSELAAKTFLEAVSKGPIPRP